MVSMPGSRRGLLKRVLLGAVGAGVAAVPLGCAGRGRAAAVEDGGPALIMIIRHGEKPDGSGKPYGVTTDGERSEGSLTTRGWARAGALVELFAPAGGAVVRAGLARPVAVFAAAPKGDAGLRPSQTVTPLAARLGTRLDTRFGRGDEKALAAELLRGAGPVLVSWQHEAIPDIAAALGAVGPRPPASWPGDRYDLVWVFRRAGSGWRFTQVAQALLAGDAAAPA